MESVSNLFRERANKVSFGLTGGNLSRNDPALNVLELVELVLCDAALVHIFARIGNVFLGILHFLRKRGCVELIERYDLVSEDRQPARIHVRGTGKTTAIRRSLQFLIKRRLLVKKRGANFSLRVFSIVYEIYLFSALKV